MQSFAALTEAVYERRPVLRNIISANRDRNLSAYAKQVWSTPFIPDKSRKAELIEAVGKHALPLLGESAARNIERSLERRYIISTADHHGPLTHPFFVHADLLAAAESNAEALIVLATSNVSLGNSSFPRSLLFHARAEGEPQRLHLFPASARTAPVFGHGPYERAAIHHAIAMLEQTPLPVRENLRGILSRVYTTPAALAQATFSNQVTVTNAALWKLMFHRSDASMPDLAYLALEDIVIRLLLGHHMDGSTEFSAFLFDAGSPEAIERSFDGISSAFSTASESGTFLFWHVSAGSSRRVSLWRDGTALAAKDDAYRIELAPEPIRRALEAGELIPSTMLSLTLLSSYYGLKCIGGFSQTTYLGQMQRAYREVMGTSEPMPETDGFCSDLIIGFLDRGFSHPVPATGLDFALYSDSESWARFVSAASSLTLEASLGLMMPDLYRILYAGDERDPALMEITQEEIFDHFHLESSIVPCLMLPP